MGLAFSGSNQKNLHEYAREGEHISGWLSVHHMDDSGERLPRKVMHCVQQVQ